MDLPSQVAFSAYCYMPNPSVTFKKSNDTV